MIISKSEAQALITAIRLFQEMYNKSAAPLDMEAYNLSRNFDTFIKKLASSNSVSLSRGEIENSVICLQSFVASFPKDKLTPVCITLIEKLTPYSH